MAMKRNSEGYYDPTAYQALKNIEKAERSKRRMNIRRGDVFYIESYYQTGSEQRAGRPAIVVSNDKNNQHSATVEVVYLTTQPKSDLPTHVTIRSLSRESTALCEQITTVSTERLGDYKGHISADEMSNLEIAILISLDLSIGEVKEKVIEKPVEVIKEVQVPVVAESAGGGVRLVGQGRNGGGKGKMRSAPSNVRCPALKGYRSGCELRGCSA